MNVDAEDNVWIADPSSSIIQKISPDGKLMQPSASVATRRLGRGQGQRLLWEPMTIAFAPEWRHASSS